MKTHYFIAVPLSSELKSVLGEQMLTWKEQLPFKKWVHPDDLHLTLAFLGDADKEQLDFVKTNINHVIKEYSPFPLSISRTGIFGKEEKPRIFWMGILHSLTLTQLRDEVYDRCLQVGFELDQRPFRPHVTLARKWNGAYSFPARESISASIFPGGISWEVNEVVLYRIHLNRTPKYERIYSWRLNPLE